MCGRTVTILGSGFGLGLYIPCLLAERRFSEKGVNAEVLIFENLISRDNRESIIKSSKASHKNFSYAKISGKMSVDMSKSIEPDLLKALLDSWVQDNRQDFIVLSGHWVYVLDEYRSRIAPDTLNAEILYIDCELPPSWKNLKHHKPDYNRNYHEKWMFDYQNSKIQYQLPVSSTPPIPFNKRPERFLLHGGGWGIGTYMDKIPELHKRGLKLDIVVHDMEEASNRVDGDRYFMIDPSWRAWNKREESRIGFPPFGEVKYPAKPIFEIKDNYHNLFAVTQNARAIIGKTGAGTLIDSLASGTPIIMLEPVGEHEEKNLLLWERLGFGITYNQWETDNFSMDLLRQLHINLLKGRETAADYIDGYMHRNNLLK